MGISRHHMLKECGNKTYNVVHTWQNNNMYVHGKITICVQFLKQMAQKSHNKSNERGLPGNCLALPRAHRGPETSATSPNREGESGNI